MILAVDPGTKTSALVMLQETAVVNAVIENNLSLRDRLNKWPERADDILLVEWVESFGMPVGREVFETCLWIGRFVEAWGGPYRLLPRRHVKLELCGSSRAKDANVRQALLDSFPATGGGKTPQVGTAAKQGPLYGIKSHLWSALAVAVTFLRTEGRQHAGRATVDEEGSGAALSVSS